MQIRHQTFWKTIASGWAFTGGVLFGAVLTVAIGFAQLDIFGLVAVAAFNGLVAGGLFTVFSLRARNAPDAFVGTEK